MAPKQQEIMFSSCLQALTSGCQASGSHVLSLCVHRLYAVHAQVHLLVHLSQFEVEPTDPSQNRSTKFSPVVVGSLNEELCLVVRSAHV